MQRDNDVLRLPPNFCITIVFSFLLDDCYTQQRLETKVMENSGGVNRVYYAFVKLAMGKDAKNKP